MPPARPSLALDLARQAAAAALAENQAAPAPTGGPHRWQPPALPTNFALTPALQQAVHQVAGHLGQWLRHEGLEVATSPQPPATKSSNPPSSAGPEPQLQVREMGNGRVVRGYSTGAVLGLFASQQQRTGVVVDGQV